MPPESSSQHGGGDTNSNASIRTPLSPAKLESWLKSGTAEAVKPKILWEVAYRLGVHVDKMNDSFGGDRPITIAVTSASLLQELSASIFTEKHEIKNAYDFYTQAAAIMREWLINRLDHLTKAGDDSPAIRRRFVNWATYHREADWLQNDLRSVHDLLHYIGLHPRWVLRVLKISDDVYESRLTHLRAILGPHLEKARGQSK